MRVRPCPSISALTRGVLTAVFAIALLATLAPGSASTAPRSAVVLGPTIQVEAVKTGLGNPAAFTFAPNWQDLVRRPQERHDQDHGPGHRGDTPVHRRDPGRRRGRARGARAGAAPRLP